MFGVNQFQLLLSIVLSLALAQAAWAELPADGDTGLVVLRNGSLVRGRVSRVGQRWTVAVAGGEIRLRADEVELVCRNLDEAYRIKAQAVAHGEAVDHLDLAAWCLQHALLGHAATELIHAHALAPDDPKIELLERRLAEATASPVRRTRTETPVAQPGRQNSELDALVAQLPVGTVEQFTTTVQPLLMNHCALGGCHGQGSENDYALERVSPGRMLNRRATQRNLQATLRLVSHDNPPSSPLLVVPIAAHGGQAKPVFSDHQAAQYQHLVRWVDTVVFGQRQEESSTVVASQSALLQSLSNSLRRPANAQAASRPDFEQAFAAPVTTPGARRPQPGQSSERVQRGAPRRPSPPVDPFDPQAFNRQHAGQTTE